MNKMKLGYDQRCQRWCGVLATTSLRDGPDESERCPGQSSHNPQHKRYWEGVCFKGTKYKSVALAKLT